jgi:aminocarboxymuconate-semialdehyde decarboxylase
VAKFPIVDIHAHFYPEQYLKVLDEEGESFGVRIDRSNAKGVVIRMRDGVQGPLRPAFTDLKIRLREMNRKRVDVHALSLTRPMLYWASGPLGLRLAQATNDAMAEAHVAFPNRFVGLAVLPMQDTHLALEELERASRLPGIRGAYMGTNINGRDLSDPDYFPVFERMEELRLPMFLHPDTILRSERLKPYYLYNLLGFPFDTAVAVAHLIFGGVLDRFPRLAINLVHGGGVFPYLAGRMNRGHKVSDLCKGIKRKPSTYLKRFTYDTITHDPGLLLYLIRTVGADRVMLGSDYCFAIGYDRPVEVVTRLSSLSRADRDKILGSNAARLLKLG